MSEEALLPAVVLNPPAGTEHRASVIWMHGLGADGHDFEPVVPMLGIGPEHGVRYVFPHAPAIPVTLNMGMTMPAWYDISEIDLRRCHDEGGIRRSAERIRDWIAHEREAGIPSEQIVLAGFSQGGAIALFVGTRHDEPLAGILALSTYLVCEESLDAEASEANAETPIFQAHGSLDPMVPQERGEAARDRLLQAGYPVAWHSYPMQHQVVAEEIAAVGAWLRERIGG